MKNADRKSEKHNSVFLTAADAGLLWNFSSVGTGISSEREAVGFTSRCTTETMSGDKENTTVEQRALEGKLRITHIYLSPG